MDVNKIFEMQKKYFRSGETLTIAYRRRQLMRLKEVIKMHEQEIIEAIHQDFGKSAFEVYSTEIGQFYTEINSMIRNCKKWSRAKRARVSIANMPGTARVMKEPYGVTLIIGPFNYPCGLLLMPLAGAMAAGNCVVVKPSEQTMKFTEVLTKAIRSAFDEKYLYVCDPSSGKKIVTELLDLPFDYIFFTGSVRTGKVIMEKSAKYLTPMTLELGGKSPCIVEADCNVKMAAKRIVWGKLINAGQTCVAPDYILANKKIKNALLKALKEEIQKQYGKDAKKSEDYCRIISEETVGRLAGYLNDGTIYYGGNYDVSDRYVEPTILVDVNPSGKVMQDEIFGPILPVLEYNELDEVVKNLQTKRKPLALYIFSADKRKIRYVLSRVSSGGACINDTIMQAGCPDLPFGGVGNSGVGAYHGKATFDTFSHSKGVYQKPQSFDVPMRYAPYKNKIELVRKVLK